MSSEMSDRELGLVLRSLSESPVPPMPPLSLPPRPAAASPLPAWILWCVGVCAALTLGVGGSLAWWLLHGGLGVAIGELAALSAQSAPTLMRGLGFTDAILAGALIALMLSPLTVVLVPRSR